MSKTQNSNIKERCKAQTLGLRLGRETRGNTACDYAVLSRHEAARARIAPRYRISDPDALAPSITARHSGNVPNCTLAYRRDTDVATDVVDARITHTTAYSIPREINHF